jgi:hypothetical protein
MATKSSKNTAKNLMAGGNTKNVSLTAYLNHVRRSATAAVAAGEPFGACLVQDPHTGQTFCVKTDSKTCTLTLKGTFIGGPCGVG